PSSPANVTAASFTVTFLNGSGGGTGGTTISASSTSISLSSPGNLSTYVTINSSSASNLTLTTSVTSGASWLTASLTSATVSSTSPTSVFIQASPTGLQNGTTYQGNITVTPSSGTAISIFVSFAVTSGGGSGALTITPQNTATWSYTTGGSLPATQNY